MVTSGRLGFVMHSTVQSGTFRAPVGEEPSAVTSSPLQDLAPALLHLSPEETLAAVRPIRPAPRFVRFLGDVLLFGSAAAAVAWSIYVMLD